MSQSLQLLPFDERPALSLFQPLESPEPQTLLLPSQEAELAEISPQAPVEPPSDMAALQARLDALQSLLELRLPQAPPALTPLSAERAAADALRLLEPGVIHLRDCFNSDLRRNSTRREPSTWADYLRTVESLESGWGDWGPDVRAFTPTSLQVSFEKVGDWKSRETWKKQRRYLFGILRAGCRQTNSNPFGVPKSETALLRDDDLPVWELPAEKWFLSRGQAPSLKLPALMIEEFNRILAACDRAVPDAIWWRTLLSFWWFCAMRRTDTLDNLKWFNPQTGLGVDVQRRWLRWQAAKPPHELHDIPLPEWLCVGLRSLAQRKTELVFHRATGRSKLSRWLYPSLKAICEAAGVTYRDPTGFRDSCSTHWDEHDPQMTNRFTAHKETSVVKTHYIVPNEQQLRASADRHPRPNISLDAQQQGTLF